MLVCGQFTLLSANSEKVKVTFRSRENGSAFVVDEIGGGEGRWRESFDAISGTKHWCLVDRRVKGPATGLESSMNSKLRDHKWESELSQSPSECHRLRQIEPRD